MHLVAPSILSADFAFLERDIQMINNSKADWFHLDVMDGVFVPNISFGFPVIKAIHRFAKKPLDIHLMITDPDPYIATFAEIGAHVISVHLEACPHLHRTVQHIKSQHVKAGVAINPHTPVSMLSEIIADIDLVCMMSVNPGFGGQQFIANTFNKIAELKKLIAEKNSNALIEIDGGVDLANFRKLVDSGAGVLVAGNTVFSSSDPVKTIADLKSS